MTKPYRRLDDDCEPKSNERMGIFTFFAFTQGEKVGEFVTGLKGLADSCSFGDLKDSHVCEIIVYRCKNDRPCARLLRKPDADLRPVIEIAKGGKKTFAQCYGFPEILCSRVVSAQRLRLSGQRYRLVLLLPSALSMPKKPKKGYKFANACKTRERMAQQKGQGQHWSAVDPPSWR